MIVADMSVVIVNIFVGVNWLVGFLPAGVGMRPHNIKDFHFLVKSRLAVANPLSDF